MFHKTLDMDVVPRPVGSRSASSVCARLGLHICPILGRKLPSKIL